MLRISEFAALCGCSVDTLRYYDRLDLLKPLTTDESSGYRFYIKDQLETYRRIRGLQTAGISLGEIRNLMHMTDQEILKAIDQRIIETNKKLDDIQNIRKAFQESVMKGESYVQNGKRRFK